MMARDDRDPRFAPVRIIAEDTPHGVTLTNDMPLIAVSPTVPAVLRHWAAAAPDAPFLSERADDGWITRSYAQVADAVIAHARRLVSLGCDTDRPLAILAPNSILHAELALAAQYIGVPGVAISLAYAGASADYERLRDMISRVGPAAIFVADPAGCADAIAAIGDLAMIVTPPGSASATGTALDDITPSADTVVAERASTVGPDSVARLLFTSGSTGKPKAVIIPSACCAQTRRCSGRSGRC
jgi:feruloyl-CoA synthase